MNESIKNTKIENFVSVNWSEMHLIIGFCKYLKKHAVKILKVLKKKKILFEGSETQLSVLLGWII